MPKRLLSFLLVLLMVWSAVATQEQPIVMPANTSDIAMVIAAEYGQDGQHDGSVADHHLDDQPAQTHASGAADLDGLLPAECRVPNCVVEISFPTRPLTQLLPSPYLDGLQRPPRASSFLG